MNEIFIENQNHQQKIQKMYERLNKLDNIIDEYQHDRDELQKEMLAEYKLLFENSVITSDGNVF